MTGRNTYEEAAAEMDALKDSGQEMEGLTPTEMTVDQNVGFVFSVRLSRDEMSIIRAAADARGVKVSEIIRAGALKEARGGRATAESTKALKAARKELLAARKAIEKTERELEKAS